MAKIVDPLVHKLLRDIRELTDCQFIYEDPWHGFVPYDGAPTEYQFGPAFPFEALSRRDKTNVLYEFISWKRYENEGLIWLDRRTIFDNVINDKPPHQWLEGTSFLDPSLRAWEQGREAFDRIAADPGKEWDATFGVLVTWENVATANKVGFLASYAVIHDVPFERFEQAVQDALGRREALPGEEWTLQGQYDGARIMVGRNDPQASKTPSPGTGPDGDTRKSLQDALFSEVQPQPETPPEHTHKRQHKR
jgi:hypothetical protein